MVVSSIRVGGESVQGVTDAGGSAASGSRGASVTDAPGSAPSDGTSRGGADAARSAPDLAALFPGLDASPEFPDRTPRAIAAVLARLINDGDLAPGIRLPTVRELGTALGVSPATISQSWQALARAGLIESRGRAGSFVRDTAPTWLAPACAAWPRPTTPCGSTSRAARPTPCCCRRSVRRSRASRPAPRRAATSRSP
ncbi:hypothetical protein GCM10025877_13230 [Agromyces mangrovi Wang et al. 2018]|nr:hypothetical protein GCM10025877_13230 [Agromyces mangrovi]